MIKLEDILYYHIQTLLGNTHAVFLMIFTDLDSRIRTIKRSFLHVRIFESKHLLYIFPSPLLPTCIFIFRSFTWFGLESEQQKRHFYTLGFENLLYIFPTPFFANMQFHFPFSCQRHERGKRFLIKLLHFFAAKYGTSPKKKEIETKPILLAYKPYVYQQKANYGTHEKETLQQDNKKNYNENAINSKLLNTFILLPSMEN